MLLPPEDTIQLNQQKGYTVVLALKTTEGIIPIDELDIPEELPRALQLLQQQGIEVDAEQTPVKAAQYLPL